MKMLNLKQNAAGILAEHPEHRDAILDIIGLAEDEIAGGGSESHECELAWQDIKFLTEEEEC